MQEMKLEMQKAAELAAKELYDTRECDGFADKNEVYAGYIGFLEGAAWRDSLSAEEVAMARAEERNIARDRMYFILKSCIDAGWLDASRLVGEQMDRYNIERAKLTEQSAKAGEIVGNNA